MVEHQDRDGYEPPEYQGSAEPQKTSTRLVAAIVGAAAIVALVALGTAAIVTHDSTSASSSTSTSASAAPAAPKVVGLAAADALAPAACPDGRKYFWAYDAPARTNAMGPKLSVPSNDEGARIARDRWWTKWVCDPAWSGHAFEGQTVNDPKNFDPAAAQNKSELFNTNSVEWQNAVNQVAQDITGFELRDYGTTRYDSVGLIPDPSGDRSKLPHMTKWGEQPELHLVLVVKTKTHGERLYRLDCDEQFSAPELVKFTPPPSTPPQTTTTTQPPCPNCTTTTTTTKPPCENCTTTTTTTTTTTQPPCKETCTTTTTTLPPKTPDGPPPAPGHTTVGPPPRPVESSLPPETNPVQTGVPTSAPAPPDITAPSATTPAPDVNTSAPPITQAPSPDDPADTDVTPVG